MQLCKEPIFSSHHHHQPAVVVESLGNVEQVTELGHRISALSGDNREISFLFQRVLVVVQQFSFVLLRESFCRQLPRG